jgi:hypothetical protein
MSSSCQQRSNHSSRIHAPEVILQALIVHEGEIAMKAILGLSALLLLSACAQSSLYSLAEQCGHKPGCFTTSQPTSSDIQQVRAIEPQNAGKWQPVIPARRPK